MTKETDEQHSSKDTLVKVRQSQNDFFKPTFLPKTNERIQLCYCDTSGRLVFVCFWKKLKTAKRRFEIN